MGLLESLKGLLGKKDSGLKDQAMDFADRNNDGKVDMTDLSEVKNAADVNQDGAINKEDLAAAKDKFSN